MSALWYDDPITDLDSAVRAAARERQSQLTKPPGSLGRLEELGTVLAAMQGTQQPRVENIWITVFAGDHGVTAEGVSAFPQAVTAEMVRNFARGGAAISVLAQEWSARLEVINVGTVQAIEELPGVLDARVGPGTANFVREPAMTVAQLQGALAAGRGAAERAAIGGAHLFVGGEMGIGNLIACLTPLGLSYHDAAVAQTRQMVRDVGARQLQVARQHGGIARSLEEGHQDAGARGVGHGTAEPVHDVESRSNGQHALNYTLSADHWRRPRESRVDVSGDQSSVRAHASEKR